MKPKPDNKKVMVRGMQKTVDRMQDDDRRMGEIFFIDGKEPTGPRDYQYEHYTKDQVSKDLGVPIHQIEPAYSREWEQKGFEKPTADEWWCEPNGEKMRALKMLSGGSPRKDFVMRDSIESQIIHIRHPAVRGLACGYIMLDLN